MKTVINLKRLFFALFSFVIFGLPVLASETRHRFSLKAETVEVLDESYGMKVPLELPSETWYFNTKSIRFLALKYLLIHTINNDAKPPKFVFLRFDSVTAAQDFRVSLETETPLTFTFLRDHSLSKASLGELKSYLDNNLSGGDENSSDDSLSWEIEARNVFVMARNEQVPIERVTSLEKTTATIGSHRSQRKIQLTINHDNISGTNVQEVQAEFPEQYFTFKDKRFLLKLASPISFKMSDEATVIVKEIWIDHGTQESDQSVYDRMAAMGSLHISLTDQALIDSSNHLVVPIEDVRGFNQKTGQFDQTFFKKARAKILVHVDTFVNQETGITQPLKAAMGVVSKVMFSDKLVGVLNIRYLHGLTDKTWHIQGNSAQELEALKKIIEDGHVSILFNPKDTMHSHVHLSKITLQGESSNIQPLLIRITGPIQSFIKSQKTEVSQVRLGSKDLLIERSNGKRFWIEFPTENLATAAHQNLFSRTSPYTLYVFQNPVKSAVISLASTAHNIKATNVLVRDDRTGKFDTLFEQPPIKARLLQSAASMVSNLCLRLMGHR